MSYVYSSGAVHVNMHIICILIIFVPQRVASNAVPTSAGHKELGTIKYNHYGEQAWSLGLVLIVCDRATGGGSQLTLAKRRCSKQVVCLEVMQSYSRPSLGPDTVAAQGGLDAQLGRESE
ncbi:hypothetical protein VM1G_11854 [Cytospora mali]|uniref:Uncharacterized protein n=1 Tax=Cytospora mali TaxID=578113 RepID=A0A194W9I2_CYTMA|nr:hypothetical protein VM1G_11854 [Valsa mali]